MLLVLQRVPSSHLMRTVTTCTIDQHVQIYFLSAAPYVTLFEARRLNETHFNISISLLYTGGGDITTFSVYFREWYSLQWSSQPIMVLSLDSEMALEYHGVISGDETLRGKGPLEFELRVKNGEGFINRTGSRLEISRKELHRLLESGG